ncbi:MAG: methylenetetrahydrofolate reductase [Coriobacteriaceae bacterium]|jgi:methylenetetrahydrofolate reductase (NADPH)|nr:methylenetetrahydrofolate reductase [Coriobacteriaceae bacterium]
MAAKGQGQFAYNSLIMKIIETYQAPTPLRPVSFEVFPPKGDLSQEAAYAMAAELTSLSPDFISVTYSAGGSGNKSATVEVASMIQEEFKVPVMAHLTCIDMTAEGFDAQVAALRSKGIENVLALRGDRVPGSEPSDFPYAKDLIVRLREEGFCVGAAAYPEGHIECMDFPRSIEHLKLKQDAGAQFFLTQLFFDNQYFYRFQEAALAAGIAVPLSCGIMPFLGVEQIKRMVFMCGASLPSPIIKLLAKYADAPDDLRKAGIEYACAQLVDLAQNGAEGFHIYTMNQPRIARGATEALRAVL